MVEIEICFNPITGKKSNCKRVLLQQEKRKVVLFTCT